MCCRWGTVQEPGIMKTLVTAKTLIKSIFIPKGFVVEFVKGAVTCVDSSFRPPGASTTITAILTHDEQMVKIFIPVVSGKKDTLPSEEGDAVGYVFYKDLFYKDQYRRWHSLNGPDGISFRVNCKSDERPKEIIYTQLMRVKEQRDRMIDTTPLVLIPEIGHTISTKERGLIALKLKKGLEVVIKPPSHQSGFVHTVTMKRKTPWARKSDSLAQFFGLESAYIESDKFTVGGVDDETTNKPKIYAQGLHKSKVSRV